MDWDQFTFWNAVPRHTILKFHQFPLWNPYSYGGNVALALPHSCFLSPFYILILLFGPVLGLKLQWIVSLYIGMLGMFFLSAHFKIKEISRYFSAAVYMLSSFLALHLAEGQTEWLVMAFLPWFFLSCIKAYSARKYLFWAVFFLSLMALGGSVDVLSISIVLITIYTILVSFQKKKVGHALSLSFIFLITLLICSVKLVPMAEFLKENPRRIESEEKNSISMLPDILLSHRQGDLYQNTKWTTPDKQINFKGRDYEYGWHEYGAYVGWIPLLLTIIGICFCFKEQLPLLLTGALSLWISLGKGAFYNLWGIFHKLPVYSSLHVPSRFILGFIFCAALFAGLGLSKIEGKASKRWVRGIIKIMVAGVFLDLLLVNYPLLNNTFTLDLPRVARYSEFKQRYRDYNLFPGKSRSSMFPVFLSNSGILNGYEVVNVKKGDVKAIMDPDYKGEVYLSGAKGDVAISSFSPNKIIIDAQIREGGLLLLNQNYYKGWHVLKDGECFSASSFNGLISTPVSAKDKEIAFYFLPFSFLIGSAITLMTIITGVIIFCSKKARSFVFRHEE